MTDAHGPAAVSESELVQAESQIDVADLLVQLREQGGPGRVEARRAAEDRARALLDSFAGRMTVDQVRGMGKLFNLDLMQGEERHWRFAPAFHGATINRLTEQIDDTNLWIQRLWSRSEEEAKAAADDLISNASTLPGSGRSLPTMLLYLRDPERYAVWINATDRGLRVLTDYKGASRRGGLNAYLEFCRVGRELEDAYGIEPQELDLILSAAARLETGSPAVHRGSPLTSSAFEFLRDLVANNTSDWMNANRDRYRKDVREPIRSLMEDLAHNYIGSLDPSIDIEVKLGHVMASIRKRFPDEEGEYYPYYWGAFSRSRKQEDLQLFVILYPDSLHCGFGPGSSATPALEPLRQGLPAKAESLWEGLGALAEQLKFQPSGGHMADSIPVRTSEELVAWGNGPNPTVFREFLPDDPAIGTTELMEHVGRTLTALYPLAALGWGVDIGRTTGPKGEETEEDDHYTLAQLAADTLLPPEDLEEWAALLTGSKRQALFYGPPGTGKTFVAGRLGRFLAQGAGEVRTVQFHPSFSYEDFMEGLRPIPDIAGIRYEVRPGVFQEFCDLARQDLTSQYVLVVDEVNRADLSSVFGELMFLLEYRGASIQLPYSQRKFSVPSNVVVLATMNTADRSIALVDYALRRRFHAIELWPNREVLAGSLAADSQRDLTLAFFDLVQARMERSEFAPGHSYWMVDDLSPSGLLRVWKYEIRPYLTEFWFEHPAQLDELETEVVQLLAEDA